MARLIASDVEYIWLALSIAAVFAPRLTMPILARRCVAWLCASTWRAVLAAALFPVVIRLLLLPWLPVPVPGIHDEFGHLLTAETLSLGRLANPVPVMWQHFETFHVYFQPVYASIYFPGNSICMALSFALVGHPWPGVVLSVALLCGAVVWALERWVPRHWALWGGVLMGLRFGIVGYWMNSYWGGAMAALGGVLLIGAIGVRRPFHGVAFGLGCAVLLFTRPFEGLIVVLVVVLFARVWRVGTRLAPVAAIGVVALAAFGYYNYRLTGDALTPPYRITAKLYNDGNVLPGLSPRTQAEFRHVELKRMAEEFEAANGRVFATWESTLKFSWEKLSIWRIKLLGPLLTIPLFYGMWRDRRFGAALVCGLAGYGAHQFIAVHYFAPLVGLQWMLLLRGWRGLAMSPKGAQFALWIGLGCVVSSLWPYNGEDSERTWGCCTAPGNLRRAEFVRKLEAMGGRHLVMVRYNANHNVHEEWVFNRADIKGAKIVWARQMSLGSDSILEDSDFERMLWWINPDEPDLGLRNAP